MVLQDPRHREHGCSPQLDRFRLMMAVVMFELERLLDVDAVAVGTCVDICHGYCTYVARPTH